MCQCYTKWMGDIESIPCVNVLQNGRTKFKYNLCVSVIQNEWVTLSHSMCQCFTKWTGEIQVQPICQCYKNWMGDIESVPCVTVFQNGRVKFKYNLSASVIKNGWVTLNPFYVLLFFMKQTGEIQIQSVCQFYTKCISDIESILCVGVLQNRR